MNWKEYGRKRSWSNLRYYPGIGLDILGKITKDLSQSSGSPFQDFNTGPPEYEAEVVTARRQLSGLWRWVDASSIGLGWTVLSTIDLCLQQMNMKKVRKDRDSVTCIPGYSRPTHCDIEISRFIHLNRFNLTLRSSTLLTASYSDQGSILGLEVSLPD
jgi:hypothetical protein